LLYVEAEESLRERETAAIAKLKLERPPSLIHPAAVEKRPSRNRKMD
jgi:hypothetical protein